MPSRSIPPTALISFVADQGNNRIQVFSSSGIFLYAFGSVGSGDGQLMGPTGVAVDLANGSNVLVADQNNARIQVFSASGDFLRTIKSVYTFGPNPETAEPFGIAVDPGNGNNVLVTTSDGGVGVYADGASPLAAAILPGGRSVELPNAASVFATVLNTGSEALSDCRIDILAPGVTSLYQTTDPTTNGLTGTPNMPATIPGNGSQSFFLSFQSGTAQALEDWPLMYECQGPPPAAVTPFVNTIDLTFSTIPTADIIVLATTPSNNGILTIPFSQGQPAAFAVATDNAGATGQLTAVVDTGTATLPLQLTMCQTNPSNGQCLPPLSPQVPVTIDAGATLTFSVFATATGQVPFAPGTSRIFVRFIDSSNIPHGSIVTGHSPLRATAAESQWRPDGLLFG